MQVCPNCRHSSESNRGAKCGTWGARPHRDPIQRPRRHRTGKQPLGEHRAEPPQAFAGWRLPPLWPSASTRTAIWPRPLGGSIDAFDSTPWCCGCWWLPLEACLGPNVGCATCLSTPADTWRQSGGELSALIRRISRQTPSILRDLISSLGHCRTGCQECSCLFIQLSCPLQKIRYGLYVSTGTIH